MGSSKKPNKQVFGKKTEYITLTPGNIVKSQCQQEQSEMNKDNTHYTQQTQCAHTYHQHSHTGCLHRNHGVHKTRQWHILNFL